MSLQTSERPRKRAYRTKVDLTWTDGEDRVIRALYPDYNAIQQALRHRSYHALRSRARQINVGSKRHVWTNVEDAKLTKLWRQDQEVIQAAFPTMKWDVIYKHGIKIKLPHRGKLPYVLTGNPVCDAVRDRCRELGYSMKYLDEIAGTGHYFGRSQWLHQVEHSWKYLIKAVKALGGVLKVEFPD